MAAAPIESLRPDTPLKPLYIIHGEEDLLRIEALDTLRAAAKKQGYLNREVYTAENNFDWNELLQSAGSAGLFADLKLLEIHIPNGKPGKNGGDALQTFAERLPEDTVTLILLPKLEKAQIQSKWFSALAGKGIVLEAKAVAPHALPQWIQGRLKQQGLDIEPEALALFAERVEGNLLAARQEIEKLALLHPQGHLINIADAEAAVATVARFDVFQLAGAWMKGDALRVFPFAGRFGRRRRRAGFAVVGSCRRHPHPNPPDCRTQAGTKHPKPAQQPAFMGRQADPCTDGDQTHFHQPPARRAQNLRQNRPHHQRRGRRRCMDRVQTTRYFVGRLKPLPRVKKLARNTPQKQKIL